MEFIVSLSLRGTAAVYDECRGICEARGGGISFFAAVRPGGFAQMRGVR